jgi:N-acetylglucosaminyldiphosphoundecaprenol N-acetyl-beta-D-mannosaminyltransferase
MIDILGIKLNNLNKKEIEAKINSCFLNSGSYFLTTPNPEIILEAQKNEELFYILNKADFSFPDGFGLKIAGLFLGKILNRQTGADLTLKLLKLSQKRKYKILLVIWEKGLSSEEDIAKALNEKYPGLEFLIISIARGGGGINWEKINKFSPKIMLVGIGSPWQEKFCYLKKYKIPSLKISVGIGGALDFVSKKIKRV